MITKHEKAQEVAEMTGLLKNTAFSKIKSLEGDFSLSQSQWITVHTIMEAQFLIELEKAIDNGIEPFLWKSLEDKVVKSLSDLNKDASVKEFQKIERKFWKDFLKSWSLNRNIQLIPSSQISEEKEFQTKIKTSNCAYYALSRINDFAAAKVLGGKIGFKDPIELLSLLTKQFNYKVVNQSKKDDLIIYFDEIGRGHHFGYFYDAMHVESKWGKMPVFRHLPHEVPYENSYLIFRKTV